MNTNLKKISAIANINFRKSTWVAYLVAGIFFAASIVQTIILYLINQKDNSQVSGGNTLIIVLMMAAILVPSLNFGKIMHLNGKKKDFFWACLVNYVIFSAAISFLCVLIHMTFDKVMETRVTILDILDVFGWIGDGVVIAFFREFAFLLLLAAAIHILTALQTFWYGWVIDGVIAAIISVFTPIAPLRAELVAFFHMIIFNPSPIAQISVCLALATGIYALYLPILSRKRI
ncbi:MAG TPA: hypothetical protein VHP38_05235 [Ruminiclostridium sp.]|nr:hypothetical protein [Ruminiclostridium sp.]